MRSIIDPADLLLCFNLSLTFHLLLSPALIIKFFTDR